jgi:hypothetical protein
VIFFHRFAVRILDQLGDNLFLNLILIIALQDGPGSFSRAESLELYIPIQSPVCGLHLLGYYVAGDLEEDFPFNWAGFLNLYLHALLKLLKIELFALSFWALARILPSPLEGEGRVRGKMN